MVAPQILDGGGVGRAPEVLREGPDRTNIAGLRLGIELAHPHVVDHALPQWADARGGCFHDLLLSKKRRIASSSTSAKTTTLPT